VPIGEFTEQQLTTRSESKRKTIKMLATVVVVFAVCWLPINVYHIINDFFATDSLSAISINTYLACHWLAFSSVCWNPFIYFGLNPYYRHELNRIFLRGKHRNGCKGSCSKASMSCVCEDMELYPLRCYDEND
ncbi:unnamed protein product, partial [Oppiella nova]